jgi:hypothetical protein
MAEQVQHTLVYGRGGMAVLRRLVGAETPAEENKLALNGSKKKRSSEYSGFQNGNSGS